jgi:hypothetical protein
MRWHLILLLGLFALVTVVSISGCNRPSSEKSSRQTLPETVTTQPWRAPENTSIAVHLSMLKESKQYPMEEPAMLTADRDEPDATARLQAIEAWVLGPDETLDLLTYALVDPDEAVRERARERLEEELARR